MLFKHVKGVALDASIIYLIVTTLMSLFLTSANPANPIALDQAGRTVSVPDNPAACRVTGPQHHGNRFCVRGRRPLEGGYPTL